MEDKVYVAQVCLKLLILPPQPSVGTTGECYQTFHSLALDHCFDRRVWFPLAFLTITIMINVEGQLLCACIFSVIQPETIGRMAQ